MDESRYNQKIEEIANMMIHDGISIDEQDESVLEKYKLWIISNSDIPDKEAMNIVYEALLYRKLKSSDKSGDPLQKGNKFGAGFS